MAIKSKPFTFSSGGTIIAAEHNSNLDTIYGEFNGNIENANIKANAAIVGTKIDSSTIGAIGGTSPSGATFTNLVITTSFNYSGTNQGDLLFDNGTIITKLTAPNASGKFLQTGGTDNNPAWATTGFTYRTGGSGTDFDETTLTTDTNFNDLDLGGIITNSAANAVLMRVVHINTVGNIFTFRRDGETEGSKAIGLRAQVSGITNEQNMVIPINNLTLEYKMTINATGSVTVLGWLV